MTRGSTAAEEGERLSRQVVEGEVTMFGAGATAAPLARTDVTGRAPGAQTRLGPGSSAPRAANYIMHVNVGRDGSSGRRDRGRASRGSPRPPWNAGGSPFPLSPIVTPPDPVATPSAVCQAPATPYPHRVRQTSPPELALTSTASKRATASRPASPAPSLAFRCPGRAHSVSCKATRPALASPGRGSSPSHGSGLRTRASPPLPNQKSEYHGWEDCNFPMAIPEGAQARDLKQAGVRLVFRPRGCEERAASCSARRVAKTQYTRPAGQSAGPDPEAHVPLCESIGDRQFWAPFEKPVLARQNHCQADITVAIHAFPDTLAFRV
ncbi:hypothetical protein BDY21DRAFT_395992 [Lineolata rhizophorae]|uniref:Uncharacterized protein n=1 Tax=Lineolata rhizophorae TaxID=578093 RepID=A0A6A6NVK0_9PEZI|nr:hypothetical protein BDY21DRAFT_395992 [Lineolata rhizophorae]